MKRVPLLLPALILSCTGMMNTTLGDIEISGTAQAIASRGGSEDRQTIDLSTSINPIGTVEASFADASATVTVELAKDSSGSSIQIIHTLDSGPVPVGGSSSDGSFSFTVPDQTSFEFTGILEQQSTDAAGGGIVRIRNSTTLQIWYQASPNFALPNRPIDFSQILSSGVLEEGTYELTWFHAANHTSSTAQTLGSADFTLTIAPPRCRPADFNNDGVVNFFDVSAFLSAFAAMEPNADINKDGNWNFFDVSDFLSALAAGCP